MSEFDETTRRALLQQLESLHGAGLTELPRPADLPRPTQASQATAPSMASTAAPAAAPPSRTLPPEPPPASPHSSEEPLLQVSQAETLEILQQEVAGCSQCSELAATRTQTVFGVGDPQARLCFLGEAPGADEDRLGEPFVGKAGQLLNKIIQACTLRREEVFLLNTLKCRPPGNRNPAPAESQNCRGFLVRQLELIEPEFICCLGAIAAQNLLETTTPIGRLRGAIHNYRGIQVVCTYHPAYLLRNPAAKKDTWDDMKMLMGLMGVKL